MPPAGNVLAWDPHPEVWALAAVLLGGYVLAVRRIAPHVLGPGERGATPGQKRAFALGVVALLVASEWPIHELAEGSLYSVHMVQHLILTLALPPLLLLGTPAWLFRLIVPPPVMRVLRQLARPLPALAIFNAVLVFTHWPVMVGASVRGELAHFGLHSLIVASALVMWMPVLSPVLEVPRLSLPGQMMYLFLQSLVPTVPASFLTFGSRPLYPIYETLPRVWGISALTDQRAAGLVMKLVGGAVLWGVIGVLFFRWYRIERGEEGVDALEWHDVDASLNRMGLKR